MIYNTTKLLELFKLGCNIPNYSKVLTDQQIIDMLNAEMLTSVVPLVLSLKQDYFTRVMEYVNSGQSRFRLPERGIANTIRDLYFEQDGNFKRPLTLLRAEEVPYQFSPIQVDYPLGLYIEGNYLKPWPASNKMGTFKCSYDIRPNKLVTTAETVVITGVSGKTVSFASKPGSFASNVKYDIITAKSGGETLSLDLTVASTNSTSMTFNETLDTEVAVGDYLVLAKETPVPQIPEEFHEYLVQCAIVKFMESQPDVAHLKVVRERKKEMKDDISLSYKDRVKAKGSKIRVNPYRFK